MKHFITALGMLLICVGYYGQAGTILPGSSASKQDGLELEMSLGTGMGIDARSKDRWRAQPAAALGAGYSFKPFSGIRIRAGISEQVFSSTRVVEHPYPYVMDMDMNLTTIATRFIAGGDWIIQPVARGNSIYLGAAFYTDIVHYAKARNKLFYISQEERETLDLKDSFTDPLPGVQISLGVQGQSGKVELRYWEDLRTFGIPALPMNRQRRSFFGMAGSLFIGGLGR